jgi:hypothetical protein
MRRDDQQKEDIGVSWKYPFSKSFPENLDAAEEADSGTDAASYARPGNTTLGLMLYSCLSARVVTLSSNISCGSILYSDT